MNGGVDPRHCPVLHSRYSPKEYTQLVNTALELFESRQDLRVSRLGEPPGKDENLALHDRAVATHGPWFFHTLDYDEVRQWKGERKRDD